MRPQLPSAQIHTFLILFFGVLPIARPLPTDTKYDMMLAGQRVQIAVRQMDAFSRHRLYRPAQTMDRRMMIPLQTSADLDEESVVAEEPGTYVSPAVRGFLVYNLQPRNFSVIWTEFYNYTSHLNYAGRGLELSDLKVYDGKLLAGDDKTGVIFRLTEDIAVPWVILPDGDGRDNKTFKIEWMTIKDEELYIGGYGKEYTDERGDFMNDKPMWIKVGILGNCQFQVVDRMGTVRDVFWDREFKALRTGLGIQFPAYMIHESCQWSDIHQRWFFLPRRVSYDPFIGTSDQYKGTNYLIIADDTFRTIQYVRVGSVHPTRGFSAFQFVPGTNDEVIIALKSEEVTGWPYSTYVSVFDIMGRVFVDEERIPGDYKLEGLEFFDWSRHYP